MARIIGFAVLLAGSAADKASLNQGYKPSNLPRYSEGAIELASFATYDRSLPKDFDWRNVGGKSYVVADWNQHLPEYCGSCWIHGTTVAINDRIKIARQAKFPDIILNRQALLNCVPDYDNKSNGNPGCRGGNAVWIHKYLSENKVPDETCMPWVGKNLKCAPINICRNCKIDGKCSAIPSWTGYGVKAYGNVSGEIDMMREIHARGPIACAFATDPEFMFNYSKVVAVNDGVYVTHGNYTKADIDHNMEVAGWGETPAGQKYWVVRNSWGSYWGNQGWHKFARGTNQMLAESACDWAVPDFGELTEVLEGRVMGDYLQGMQPVKDPKVWAMVAGPTSLATDATKLTTEAAGSNLASTLATFVAGVTTTVVAARVFKTDRKIEQNAELLG